MTGGDPQPRHRQRRIGVEQFQAGDRGRRRARRLVELADRMHVLQVEALCWCGKPATVNARVVDGAKRMAALQTGAVEQAIQILTTGTASGRVN